MAGSHITASFPTKIIYIMLFPPELNNLQNIPHELSPYSMGSRESLSKFIVFFLWKTEVTTVRSYLSWQFRSILKVAINQGASIGCRA